MGDKKKTLNYYLIENALFRNNYQYTPILTIYIYFNIPLNINDQIRWKNSLKIFEA